MRRWGYNHLRKVHIQIHRNCLVSQINPVLNNFGDQTIPDTTRDQLQNTAVIAVHLSYRVLSSVLSVEQKYRKV